MALSPISAIQPSKAMAPEIQAPPGIVAILEQNYPVSLTPVGCNFALLQHGKVPLAEPLVLHAGNIENDAPQHWGSVSKQFTAACIADLVKKGKLKWEDDIREHLPNLPIFTLDGKPQKVTIDHLLNMRSGLPEVLTLSVLAGKNDETLSTQAKLDQLAMHPALQFTPGLQMQYCNTNYYLLAEVVSAITREKFVDYVRKEIFQPLGIQCHCSADAGLPTIDGYDERNLVNTTKNFTYGAVGIIGRPSDMAKWNAALDRREQGELLELPRGVQERPGENIYCRGLNRRLLGDYTLISHMGAVSGFTTAFMRYENKDPNKTFAFFLVANRDDIPRIEKMVGDLASTLAGQNLRMAEMPPVEKQRALVKDPSHDGNYLCCEMGTHWSLETLEERGTSILNVCFEGKEPSIGFTAFLDEKGKIYFEGPIGDRIEFTKDGFILSGAKVAPVHFLREN